MTAGSSLAQDWLSRLPAEGSVDLVKLLEEFSEFAEAICPPGFSVVVDEGLIAGDLDTGYLEADIDAYLVPPDEAPPVPGGDEPPDPDHYGHIELSLDSGSSELRLSTLDLPPVAQAAGLGTIVMTRLADLGRALGLGSIHLEAGNVGRWAWLRCGFDFDFPDQRQAVVDVAAQAAAMLGRVVDLSGIEHAWDFAELPGRVDQQDLDHVFGLRLTPISSPVPLGKALILGPPPASNPWWGRLDLDRESEGSIRLQSYVDSRADPNATEHQEEA